MKKAKRPRLLWRRQPSSGGLASICDSPRGKELRHAGETLGTVASSIEWGTRKLQGWYWYGGWDAYGVPSHNTASIQIFASMEEACSDMLRYFHQHIDAFLDRSKEEAE